MPIKTRPDGPIPAKIMIVGEAPGAKEEQRGIPFVGESGNELTKMLHEAGIARTECFLTNVSKYRPRENKIQHFFRDGWTAKGGVGTMRDPGLEIRQGIEELANEIRLVKPNVIVAFGNLPLWALCPDRGAKDPSSAKSGIGDWRGSELQLAHRLQTMEAPVGHSCVVIPTYHPAAVLRQWNWRSQVTHDLRTRVKKYVGVPFVQQPDYRFTIRPTYDQVIHFLRGLRSLLVVGAASRVVVDIETRGGHISCIGLGVSKRDAICIPFTCIDRVAGYWLPEEEAQIILLLREVLCHHNCQVVGQNFLYDAQYFAKHLGFVPRVRDDTMFQQHVAYAGMEKGLDFLSSLYCEYHRFWKHEGKEFGKYKTTAQEDEGWLYNCKDCAITFEVADVLDGVLEKLNLTHQYRFQMELWHHVLEMMLRGVNIDKAARAVLAGELANAIMERQNWIEYVAGHPLNPSSPKQMQAFFYDDLQLPKQYSRKNKKADGTRALTLDEDALETLTKKEPLIRDLVRNILEKRSLGVFLSTFVQATLGSDGRMRCYFNPAGTETYRFSSAEDAFGSGTNLQNIPRGSDEDAIEATELKQYAMPNIRKLFRPDPDFTIAEADLAGADAQVVAWRANDETLKEIFRKKLKLHVENAKLLYGHLMTSPKREPYYTRAKVGGHATNYGAKPATVAAALGITVHEADKFQKRWFEIHPGILQWQKDVERRLQYGILDENGQTIPGTARQITNLFGYRRYYFDRVDDLLAEALAWEPQSTVALVAAQGLVNCLPRHTEYSLFTERFIDPESQLLRQALRSLGFQMLLQVHDSIVFQYPTRNEHLILPVLQRALTVTIPFEDPLIIPWGLKTSTKSWGDAEDKEWPEARVLQVA